MEVSYESLREPNFMAVVGRLAQHSFRSQKTSYDVMRIYKAIEAESKNAQELFTKLLKQYAKLDDKGEILPFENRPGTFEIPLEKQADWKQGLDDFHKLSFKIERHLLKLDALEDFQLSAAEMAAAESLLELPA